MSRKRMWRKIKKSDLYKYVSLQLDCSNGQEIWAGSINSPKHGIKWFKTAENERRAALLVDLQLINHKLQPVNILKKHDH